MKRITYNKLVRDKIPDIITLDGRHAKTRVLTDNEFRAELKRKLTEEVEEFLTSENPEELADILEVIHALTSDLGVDSSKLETIRQQKRNERGGFDKRIFLITVEEN